ncbi:MAG TPA: hypothetical protein PLW65_20830, partial [Pseudomonadota bacterium]|nr:hypothetical protein [Pseudomonadota bacterium]
MTEEQPSKQKVSFTTVTEFSGAALQRAAQVQKRLAAELKAKSPAPAEAVNSSEPPASAAETAEAEPAPAEAAADAAPEQPAAGSAPAVDAQLTEQLGAELGVSGDRLARLQEALTAVGNRVGDVRLVRVFA